MNFIPIIERNYSRIILFFLCSYSLIALRPKIALLHNLRIDFFFWIFTILAIGLAIYNLFVRKVISISNSVLSLLFFLFLFGATVLSTQTYGLYDNARTWIIVFINFLALYASLITLTKKEFTKVFQYFFRFFISIDSIFVLYSCWQFFLLQGYHEVLNLTNGEVNIVRQGFLESRLFGVFTDPNYQAHLSLIIMFFLLVENNRKKIKTEWFWLLFIIHGFYLVASRSRSVILVLLVLFLFYGIWIFSNKIRQKQYRKTYISLLLLTIFGYLLTNHLIDNHVRSMSTKTENLSRQDVSIENISNNRFRIWGDLLNFIPNRPFLGFSPKKWHFIVREISPESYLSKTKYQPHNGFLELMFFSGIPAFVVFAWVVIKGMYLAILSMFRSIRISHLQFATINFMIVILLMNLFFSDTIYVLSLTGLIFYLSLAYLQIEIQGREQRKKILKNSDFQIGVK